MEYKLQEYSSSSSRCCRDHRCTHHAFVCSMLSYIPLVAVAIRHVYLYAAAAGEKRSMGGKIFGRKKADLEFSGGPQLSLSCRRRQESKVSFFFPRERKMQAHAAAAAAYTYRYTVIPKRLHHHLSLSLFLCVSAVFCITWRMVNANPEIGEFSLRGCNFLLGIIIYI